MKESEKMRLFDKFKNNNNFSKNNAIKKLNQCTQINNLEHYVKNNKVCSDDIYRNYKEFLEVLYNNGYKVTDILWFDYCKIDEQNKSLGSGGFIDKENRDYMWAETQMWDDNLENKSLSELLEHIDMTIKKYPNNNLVPSFYYKINDEKLSDKNFAFNDCSLGGTNKYYNHVAWCPFCDQGWVDIVKDIKTGALFCSCTECETEWDEPLTIKNGKGTHNKYGMITYPNEEEIDNVGLDGKSILLK